MSIADDIADDMAAKVLALTGVTPVRQWIPDSERSELQALTILVVPTGWERTIASRKANRLQVTVSVAVLNPLTSGNEDTEAEAAEAVVELVGSVLGQRLGGSRNAICLVVSQTTIADKASWREQRQFAAVLEMGCEIYT